MAVIANTKTRAVSGSHLAFTSTSPMPMHGLILSLSARGGRRFSCRSFGAGQSVQCCYSWTAAHGTRIGRPKGAGEGGYQQPTDLANIAATRLIYRGDLLDIKGSNMQVAPTLHAHGRRVQDGRQHSGFGLRQLPPCPRRRGASEGRVGLLLGGHNRKVLFITFPSHTATDVLVSAACNSAITKKKLIAAVRVHTPSEWFIVPTPHWIHKFTWPPLSSALVISTRYISCSSCHCY